MVPAISRKQKRILEQICKGKTIAEIMKARKSDMTSLWQRGYIRHGEGSDEGKIFLTEKGITWLEESANDMT